MKEIYVNGKNWHFSDADYETLAEHFRMEDAKKKLLAVIEKYGKENKEFSNIAEFLKSHIDQATKLFYEKITSDYDMQSVLNYFYGAFWCVLTLKDGRKVEAVLMDSQIDAMIVDNPTWWVYTATGEIFSAMDVLELEKDEIYVME